MKFPRVSLPIRISLYALVGVVVFKTLSAQSRLGRMPTAQEAVGDTTKLQAVQRAAFEADAAFFEAIRKPRPMDWLAQHKEPGQTVEEYRVALSALKPTAQQKVLCVLPLGEFKADQAPSLEKLRDYCTAFFGMETRILEPVALDKVPAKKRTNKNTQKLQLLTTDILTWLPSRKPRDAYALIAVTMEDLYPDEEWNFVFGQAMLQGGAGVFSFARYDPAFYGDARTEQTQALILQRSCKVLSHETGHMFGLMHCVFYECIMNGSNHLQETDSRPMHLCPVCLRKLQMGADFDLLKREEALHMFYEGNAIKVEAEWSGRRIGKMRAAK
ncbi:archaemetzincin [Prosthecobacter sp.]|uniref:archaemetzincin n=1 Tax=Prosthecobacter sp. TaxID=1965333 RepID=UPI003782DD15